MTGKIIAAVIVLALLAFGVKMYGDQRADMALLQKTIDSLETAKGELDSVTTERLTFLRDSLQTLKSQGESLKIDLEIARASSAAANTALEAARARVDTSMLTPPVRALIIAERKATKAARDEANTCSVVLINCQTQNHVLEEQNDSLRTGIADLQEFNNRSMETIDVLNSKLHPNFFGWLSRDWEKYLIGGGVVAIIHLFTGE